jgi:hypothetical protein
MIYRGVSQAHCKGLSPRMVSKESIKGTQLSLPMISVGYAELPAPFTPDWGQSSILQGNQPSQGLQTLAYSILLDITKDPYRASNLYLEFAYEFLMEADEISWEVDAEAIKEWLSNKT